MIDQRLGHYRILEKLGEGGMGEVYRAEDTKLRREVALKVLPAEFSDSRERLERFQREAHSLAALDHPNIVHIYSVEKDGDISFLTMQLVRGRSLAALIPDGGFGLDQFFALAIPLADALRAAHEKGIIHRDLKPENVMVDEEGRVKILDFGLAKMRLPAFADDHREVPTEAMTREGLVLGTVPYMSPEQVQGRPLDHRTDLFSCGVLLYEMLCGRRPFAGDNTASLISAILRDEPEPLAELKPGLPERLVALVERCLEKEPTARFQTAQALCDALVEAEREVVSGRPVLAQADLRAVRSGRGIPRVVLSTLLVILVVVLVLLLWRQRGAPTREFAGPRITSLAVLPLQNLSGDPEQEYFVDGMTEALITDLSKISALKVISRTSSMRFKGSDRTLAEIAGELGVDAVIEGSVIREGDQVGMTAQLIEVATDRNLWADRYQRDLTSILRLQAEIARAVAQEIQVTLTSQEQTLLADVKEVDPEAYEAYLKGQFYSAKITPADLETALEYFELALEHDPDYAAAWAGVSWLWSARRQIGLVSPVEATPLAKAAAERALELDAKLAEAHHAYAIAVGWGEWNWQIANSELRRAVELNPNYPEARAGFSHILMVQQRWDEAFEQVDNALELDPLSPRMQGFHGIVLLFARRYDEAIAELEKVLETVPNNPPAHSGLWQAYRAVGQNEKALEHAEAFFSLQGQTEAAENLAIGRTDLDWELAMRLAAQALTERSQTNSVAPVFLARLWAYAGDDERTLEWLEKGFDARAPNLPYVAVNPAFDFVRDDPRFEDLLQRIGLREVPGPTK